MPKFSNRSMSILETCDHRLQALFNTVIIEHDCSILCGYRGKEEQNYLESIGKSQLRFPKSKHNTSPSCAVDVAPYPIDWNDIDRFVRFGQSVKIIAAAMRIPIVWGGDWVSFKGDYPHYELDFSKLVK